MTPPAKEPGAHGLRRRAVAGGRVLGGRNRGLLALDHVDIVLQELGGVLGHVLEVGASGTARVVFDVGHADAGWVQHETGQAAGDDAADELEQWAEARRS